MTTKSFIQLNDKTYGVCAHKGGLWDLPYLLSIKQSEDMPWFFSTCITEDKLNLTSITVISAGDSYPIIMGKRPDRLDNGYFLYDDLDIFIDFFSGSIAVCDNIDFTHANRNYGNVLELVFEKGILKQTSDVSEVPALIDAENAVKRREYENMMISQMRMRIDESMQDIRRKIFISPKKKRSMLESLEEQKKTAEFVWTPADEKKAGINDLSAGLKARAWWIL